MVTTVTLAGGGQAILEDDPTFSTEGKALLRLETGRQVLIPRSALLQEGGLYRLPFTAEDIVGGNVRHGHRGADAGHVSDRVAATDREEADGSVVVPLMEETLTSASARS